MPERDDETTSEEARIVLPDNTRAERVLDTFSAVTALAPVLGGPISNILSGISGDRRFARVREVLIDLAAQLHDLSDDQQNYVRSEDFEDILIEAVQRVAAERMVEKRRLYRQLLASAVIRVGEVGYDEQLRYLRVLEQLQPDHLHLLRALMQPPEPSATGIGGSPASTLEKRLPGMSADRISDLAGQLDDLRVTDIGSLNVLMTAAGAADLRSRLAAFGQRFVAYVLEDERVQGEAGPSS